MLHRIAQALHLAEPTEDLTTAQQNAASIDSIPPDVPEGDPLPADLRAKLRERAESGLDLYAYSSAAGTWNVWSGQAVDEQTGYRGVRYPVAKWREWAAGFLLRYAGPGFVEEMRETLADVGLGIDNETGLVVTLPTPPAAPDASGGKGGAA